MSYTRPKVPPDQKKKPGRPAKPGVDPAVAKRICDNLEIAMPLTLAAEAEGVHRQTVYRWMEEFPDFALQITRAKAMGAKNLTVKALSGGKGSSMSVWILERRYEDYRPVQKIITGDEDDLGGRTLEELNAEQERIEAKIAAAAGKEPVRSASSAEE